ncbi:MAG: hypothetical protein RBS39_01660 [Phycisphaerales bacterium]|jgi:hypothetical protein|nr:hypothetical protein [Phycisphaerales bacterium]
MDVTRATEFSFYLDNRPGEMAGVLEAAAQAHVELTGLSVAEHLSPNGGPGRGIVRVVGEPLEVLRHVCESLVDSGHGPVVESEVLCVNVDARPGAVREIATRFALDKVNVRYAYLTPAVNGYPARYFVRVDDLERAEACVRSLP